MLPEWIRLGDRALAFSNPRYLPLAVGGLVLLALTLVVYLRRREAWREGRLDKTAAARLWVAGALRTVAYLLTIGAISGATIVETQREDRLRAVALIDGSRSIADGEAQWMSSWLDDFVAAMRSDDELSLLRFGRVPVVERGPGKPALPDDSPPPVDAEATNLMAAIEAGASLSAGAGGMLVLLSDGNQTLGDATAAAESARRHGVKIYPVVPPRTLSSLLIERIAAPDLVRENQDIRIDVAIANRGKEVEEATLVVRQGDDVLGRVPLSVAPGRSVVDAVVRAGRRGHYAINVTLEMPDGTERPAQEAALTILGPARVLLVSQNAALAPLLEEAGFSVERRADLQDVTDDDLATFHAVVLGEISAHDVPRKAQAALERYVRDLGGGLLLAAGRGIVSDETLRGSPLERLLPVALRKQEPEKRVRQSLALFLVIDRSSSMTYGLKLNEIQPTRISYAREAAITLIAQLHDDDLVGAVAFDTETSLLAPLRKLSTNRAPLNDMISRLVPSGGTDFKEALEIAARQLIASQNPTKHIILLTDGASIRPAAEHEAVTEALERTGVSVTSIRIGDDKDSYDLVLKIAERTGGKFYHVKDAHSLPNLMISDTRRRAGRQEQEEKRSDAPFRPKVRRSAEALGGLKTADLPMLHALAVTPLKPDAEEWLGTDHTGKPAPILTGWQNGLGRVAVFSANPSHEWQSWGHARRFWSQLIHWVARPQSDDEVRLAVRGDEGHPTLVIDTFDHLGPSTLVAKITDLEGNARELRPTATSTRHFEVALPPLETLERRIELRMERGDQEAFRRDEWLPRTRTTVRASGEDPQVEPNWPLLEQIAEITGGAVNAPIGEILTRAPADRQIAFPLTWMLVAGAFALVIVDILVRHTKWA